MDDIQNQDNQPDYEKQMLGMDEKSIRIGFVRKVFGVLIFMLAITTLIVGIVVASNPVKLFFQQQLWFGWMSFGISFFILICIACCNKTVGRQVPYNYIALILFTIFFSFFVAAICAWYNPKIVLVAAILTLGITLGLTCYACYTKTDYTWSGGILFIILFAFGFSLFFFIFSYIHWVYMIYCVLGVVIYGFFLIYDTQLIVGGKSRFQYSMDDYILAALNIYIDVIYIFLYILSLFGSR